MVPRAIRKRAIIIATVATALLLPIVGLLFFALVVGVGFSEGGTLGGYGASASQDLENTTKGNLTVILATVGCITLLVLCWIHFYKSSVRKSTQR
jgi:hypothetical protein